MRRTETLQPGVAYRNSDTKNSDPDWYKCYTPECWTLKDKTDSRCLEKEKDRKCPFPTSGEWQILNKHLSKEGGE